MLYTVIEILAILIYLGMPIKLIQHYLFMHTNVVVSLVLVGKCNQVDM